LDEDGGFQVNEAHSIQLQVKQARPRDVGRFIARINQRTMKKLDINAGNVVEIVGKQTTSAIAWKAYCEDENQDFMRIDRFIRANAGVAKNENIIVSPAKVKTALSITLAPVDMHLSVDENFINFVKNQVLNRTLVEGNTTLVMMLGYAIPFTVFRTIPDGIVKTNSESQLTILNEPTIGKPTKSEAV
jgi:transitional endoplasmic reticulum ATPase